MKPDTTISILMIDDHPSTIEGYKSMLSSSSFDSTLEITTAFDCERAFTIITDTVKYKSFDVLFLDRSMPPFEKQNIHSGEDLALLARKHRPESKIMMLTSHTEAFILYDIVKKINPEGLLIKSDFKTDELLHIFDLILKGGQYHSSIVEESIRFVSSKKVLWNAHNREIISLIAQGIKTKNLSNYLPLSSPTIERRKADIKEALDIPTGDDHSIITLAKKLRLI